METWNGMGRQVAWHTMKTPPNIRPAAVKLPSPPRGAAFRLKSSLVPGGHRPQSTHPPALRQCGSIRSTAGTVHNSGPSSAEERAAVRAPRPLPARNGSAVSWVELG
jgi:hypothetical protein